MIESFRHKGLEKLFNKSDRSGVSAAAAAKISMILEVLDAAENVEEMNLPGLRLHKLGGDRKGVFSVTVRANWRITFRFQNGNAYEVNLEDYH